MATDDFFRARIDQMIDLRHPLAMLPPRLPWNKLEASLAPVFARRPKFPGDGGIDLFGPVPARKIEFCRADYIKQARLES